MAKNKKRILYFVQEILRSAYPNRTEVGSGLQTCSAQDDNSKARRSAAPSTSLSMTIGRQLRCGFVLYDDWEGWKEMRRAGRDYIAATKAGRAEEALPSRS
jgi:hypothetical protein